MKKYTLCGLALAILGATVTPIFSQTQTTTNTSSTTSTGYVQTSKIIGTQVKSAQGEEVGVVKDVVLDRTNGCMAYTVLSTGGARASTGSKLVAVPWTVYSTTEPNNFVVRVDRERIDNAPVFEYSRINDYATSGYINNVDSYFGVSAQYGTTGTSYGAAGTTNVNTRAGTSTNVNPNPQGAANNPPPPAEGPSGAPQYPQSSPMASASPAAAASASPSASPSSHTARGQTGEESTEKGKSTAARRHRETGEQGTEEGAQTKASRHHRTSNEEGSQPEESPSKGKSTTSKHHTTTEEQGETSTEAAPTP